MKLLTYYAEVPGISNYDSLKLLAVWREKWLAAGFEPFVLSEHQARKHPYFDEFSKGLEKLPTQNAREYEMACYHRWLALAQVGGGLCGDYDVFPRQPLAPGFTDWLNDQTSTLQLLQQNCVCPCLFYASKDVAERVCREFVTREFTLREINGKPHMSDQYTLEQIVQAGAGWISQKDCTMMWSELGWETRPFVHFANRVALEQGKSPRWKFVEEVLK